MWREVGGHVEAAEGQEGRRRGQFIDRDSVLGELRSAGTMSRVEHLVLTMSALSNPSMASVSVVVAFIYAPRVG